MTTELPTPAEPAAATPTIVIVGGVAGGASAAARARRVNERARIVVIERDAHVSFANCGLPYFIGGEIEDRAKLLIATPELFRDRFRIEVRVRQEVLAIDRATKKDCNRDARGQEGRRVATPGPRQPGGQYTVAWKRKEPPRLGEALV